MKKAVKYIYGNPFYMYLKKHFCPECGNKLKLRNIRKIVNSASPQAKEYDFSCGDTFFTGDVEFRTKSFYCTNCQREFSLKEIKMYKKK